MNILYVIGLVLLVRIGLEAAWVVQHNRAVARQAPVVVETAGAMPGEVLQALPLQSMEFVGSAASDLEALSLEPARLTLGPMHDESVVESDPTIGELLLDLVDATKHFTITHFPKFEERIPEQLTLSLAVKDVDEGIESYFELEPVVNVERELELLPSWAE